LAQLQNVSTSTQRGILVMVQSSLLANTALRTPQARLPRVFCRHKSITAAIERGRQHTSRDQRFGSSATSFPSTRREAPAGSRGGYKSRAEPEQRESRPWRADRFSTPNERSYTPHRALDNSTRRREDTGWNYNGRGESDKKEVSFRDRRTERREERGFRPGPREDTFQGRRTERSDERSFRSGPKEDAFQDRRSGRGANTSFRSEQTQDGPHNRMTERREESNFRSGPKEDAFQDRRPGRGGNTSYRSEQIQDVSRDKRTERGEERSFRSGSNGNAFQPNRVVEALPYTTAASEFLYGHSSVLAALKVHRRRLFNLYIHDRGLNHQGKDAIVQHARALPFKLSIREVGDGYLRAMDKATSGRPHNVSIVLFCIDVIQRTEQSYVGFHIRNVSATSASHNRARSLIGDVGHV
jgi:21S rRNA (GM2251-2'-O)-methyltransferase